MSEAQALFEVFGFGGQASLPQCACGCDDRLHILGDAGDLKCFLPALFPLWAADALAADPEPFFERLHDYGFVIWPEHERQAVKAFLFGQWDTALCEGSEWFGGFRNAAMLLECIAWLFDPQALLERWAECESENAREQLRAFAANNLANGAATLSTAYERPLFASRIERWLERVTL